MRVPSNFSTLRPGVTLLSTKDRQDFVRSAEKSQRQDIFGSAACEKQFKFASQCITIWFSISDRWLSGRWTSLARSSTQNRQEVIKNRPCFPSTYYLSACLAYLRVFFHLDEARGLGAGLITSFLFCDFFMRRPPSPSESRCLNNVTGHFEWRKIYIFDLRLLRAPAGHEVLKRCRKQN